MSSIRLEVSGELPLDQRRLEASARMALNKVIEASRGVVVDKTTDTYRLGKGVIRRHVSTRRASQSADGLSGSVELDVRPIPVEDFKPRVQMRDVTFEWRGRQVTRRLAGVYLQRFVRGTPKLVGPAFPLRQRRSGQLRRGENIRRRIGADRAKLTRIRYYTFPRRFVREELEPALAAFVPARFSVELAAAVRFNQTKDGQTRRVVRR